MNFKEILTASTPDIMTGLMGEGIKKGFEIFGKKGCEYVCDRFQGNTVAGLCGCESIRKSDIDVDIDEQTCQKVGGKWTEGEKCRLKMEDVKKLIIGRTK